MSGESSRENQHLTVIKGLLIAHGQLSVMILVVLATLPVWVPFLPVFSWHANAGRPQGMTYLLRLPGFRNFRLVAPTSLPGCRLLLFTFSHGAPNLGV